MTAARTIGSEETDTAALAFNLFVSMLPLTLGVLTVAGLRARQQPDHLLRRGGVGRFRHWRRQQVVGRVSDALGRGHAGGRRAERDPVEPDRRGRLLEPAVALPRAQTVGRAGRHRGKSST